MRCPTCGCTAVVVASVFGGTDPHETFVCRGWKKCGRSFRIDLAGRGRVPVPHKNTRAC